MAAIRHGIVVAVILITGYAHVWAGSGCDPPGDGAVEWVGDAGNRTMEIELGESTAWNESATCGPSNATQGPVVTINIATLAIQEGFSIRFILSDDWLRLGYGIYGVTKDDLLACNAKSVAMTTDLTNRTTELDVSYVYFILVTSEKTTTSYGVNITVKNSTCSIAGEESVCSGHGACVTFSDQIDFRCHCCQGYHGGTCEYEAPTTHDVCGHVTCQNGGQCISGTEDSFTKIQPAYNSDLTTPERQQENKSLSDSQSTTGYQCVCRPFFKGARCEIRATACMSSPCVSGVCREAVDGYRCYCVPGFHGKRCELDYNECQSNPCSHGGTCVDKLDSYECVCTEGHRGSKCEIKVDMCSPSPCHANASCTQTDDRFQCDCPVYRAGPTCKLHLRHCVLNPCHNGATCRERATGYQCGCPLNFAGVHCEYLMDVFAPPLEDPSLASGSHLRNIYIVAGTMSGAIFIVVVVMVTCYCKMHDTYRLSAWKRLSKLKRSSSCPDLERRDVRSVCAPRLSADAIWEATNLSYENATYDTPLNSPLDSKVV